MARYTGHSRSILSPTPGISRCFCLLSMLLQRLEPTQHRLTTTMSDTLEVIVAHKTEEADGICTFELVSATGDALPSFTAGAHIDVNVGDGLCRQYSLCNSQAESHRYLIGVLKEPVSRGGSQAMH